MKTLALGAEPLSTGILEGIKNGQEILLTSGKDAVAKVVPMTKVQTGKKPNRSPGCLKGFKMAEDFDAPLPEFKEYIE